MSADTAGQRRPVDGDLEPILELIWSGKSLRATCLELGLHVPSTSAWLHDDEGRSAQYARAREGRAEYLQEDALTVNRAAALGVKVNEKKVDPSGAKGYLEAVKWSTARMAPKTAPVERHEHNVHLARMTRDQRQARIDELQNRRAERSGGD